MQPDTSPAKQKWIGTARIPAVNGDEWTVTAIADTAEQAKARMDRAAGESRNYLFGRGYIKDVRPAGPDE